MKRIKEEAIDKEQICIGKIIEEELRRQERTVTWLSRQIHCDRRNIYDIFSRACIDTDLLYKLSVVLHTDFFSYFSTRLQSSINQNITPPPHSLARLSPQLIPIRTDAYREIEPMR